MDISAGKNAQYVNKGDILFEQDCSYEKGELQNYLNFKCYILL